MTMVGGDNTMSPETELSRDISGKLNVFLTDSDDENEFSNEGNLVEEKKLEEIMQELYKEITTSSYNTSPPPATLNFRSPSSSSLSSSPPLRVSSSYQPLFSVDVKSESCGASMSDSSSSVMAGIDFVGPSGKLTETGKGYSSENEVWKMGMGFVDDNNNCNSKVGGGGGGGGEEMDGCDEDQEGEDGDDQWLARVLRWGPLELEEWT